ncbi:MAG: redoxin domain-containing protein [Flavipsychrobacter sp.]|nr:redoxin domain-containing protein [Flavipsychrobacter sp.]
MSIQIGQPAPDFSLFNTDKKEIKLSELKGKNVVLLFIPFAFTGVCTAELCGVRDNLSFYNDTNAAVFGISVDTPFTLKRWKEDQSYNFDLLSDFNKEAMHAYDCTYESFAMGMRGVAKRSAFVIDREGIVRYAEVLEDAGNVPDFDAIQNCLQSLN